MSLAAMLDAQAHKDLEAGLSEAQVWANADTMWVHAYNRDTPEKRWFEAPLDRAPVYRALKIDPADPTAVYAVAPFRAYKNDDGQWRILAAWPTPAILDDACDYFGIEAVVSWDPLTDEAQVMGDTSAQLVGRLDDQAIQIHASPRAFFQAWAIRRAQFYASRKSMSAHWTVPPKERDEVPGVLCVGPIDQIRWSIADLPAQIECVGIDDRAVYRSVLRAVHLPRTNAAPNNLRAAA